MAKGILRIGNAGGYWGDDPAALARQVNAGPTPDVISMDFLAEVTMSIMQKQRSRDPSLGYAKDFIPMLEGVLEKCKKQGTRIITNAGGVNPHACAQAIEDLAKRKGLKLKVAVVFGDDILPDIDALMAQGCEFRNMETGDGFAAVRARVQAANVYFGAAPVVEALKFEPDVIITGRVTDTGITIAPMIAEFGWSLSDWDKLASGIVAGHLIECGSQVTGGNFSDWRKVKSFAEIGYPIVEMRADGTFTLTKHPGTGGLVSLDTVREQLFYEMGQPKAYITPDVVADFSTIRLDADGPDRVRVSEVRGFEPTPFYKVSMAYSDGFKAMGSLVISGPDARAKAEAFAKIFWDKLGDGFLETSTEYAGWNACHRSLVGKDDGNEIILRLGARAADEKPLVRFGKTISTLVLGGPPGVTVWGGVPKVQEVVTYWPALMPKERIFPRIAEFENGKLHNEREVRSTAVGNFQPDTLEAQVAQKPSKSVNDAVTRAVGRGCVSLSRICLARSGDKGDTANIGVLARGPKAYAWLEKHLSAQLVKDLFQELCLGKVSRYTLPKMSGLNFLLEESLGGGGTQSLRIDPQGKTFAQALLSVKMEIPEEVLAESGASSC